MTKPVALVAALLAAGVTAVGAAGPADPGAKPPPAIRRLRLLDESITRLGGNGDNWHMTWAADGRQYVGLCDGFGLPGLPRKWFNSRVFTIAGDPPAPTFGYLPHYPDLLNQSRREFGRYYGFGLLARGHFIYQFLSTPRVPFYEPDPRFVGAKLIYSPDDGTTWHNQDGTTPVVWEDWGKRSRANMAFYEEPGDAFALPSVLQMGRDYRDNRDGFVYVYAPNGSADGTMNQLVMVRVPADKLLDRGSYEYFAGRAAGGGATWSRDIADRRPAHTFPRGWVNKTLNPYAWQPCVVYVAPLRTYLMTTWGMGTDADGRWFAKPSYLGFWAAPEPWGPWTRVYESRRWAPGGDAAARCYQPQISPKWIAADGRSFWLVWTDYQEVTPPGKTEKTRPYYAFNMQKVEIDVAE
jgi:hypothetical protein